MDNYKVDRAGYSNAWQAAYNNNLAHWLGEANQPYPEEVPELSDDVDRNTR